MVEYINDRFDEGLLECIQKNERFGMKFMTEYYKKNK